MACLPEGRLSVDAEIDVAVISRGLRADSTNNKYDSYISGPRGWVPFCEARDLDPIEVCAKTGEHVAQYYYWRTDSLLKSKSMGEQVRAALKAHFSPTRGLASWVVGTAADDSTPPTCFGNPAMSSEMVNMVRGQAITRARRGEMEVKRVDPIEPCHLLRCWSRHFAGRKVEEIDPRMLMAYSSTLLSINLLLRYDELVMLR